MAEGYATSQGITFGPALIAILVSRFCNISRRPQEAANDPRRTDPRRWRHRHRCLVLKRSVSLRQVTLKQRQWPLTLVQSLRLVVVKIAVIQVVGNELAIAGGRIIKVRRYIESPADQAFLLQPCDMTDTKIGRHAGCSDDPPRC
jgi:hypothetical protein